MSGEALMRMGGAMYSCGIHGTTPDPVTGICSPPPRHGNKVTCMIILVGSLARMWRTNLNSMKHLTEPIRAIRFLVLAFLLTICTDVSAEWSSY